MPIYCYESKRGKIFNLVFAMGQAPRVVSDPKHGDLTRCYQAERKTGPSTKGWPLECLASGVGASQAGELRDHLARAGVPTHVTADGNPVYRDAVHRRKALKARGIVDRASFI
jgi:hypothetical protein